MVRDACCVLCVVLTSVVVVGGGDGGGGGGGGVDAHCVLRQRYSRPKALFYCDTTQLTSQAVSYTSGYCHDGVRSEAGSFERCR